MSAALGTVARSLKQRTAAKFARGPKRFSISDFPIIQPIATGRIPELVAAVVAAGGAVHAVEPGRASLEERFLGLVDRGRAG